MAGAPQTVVVFGGTGFLGRARGPSSARARLCRARGGAPPRRGRGAVYGAIAGAHGGPGRHRRRRLGGAGAVAGAWGVVNAVSLYVEKGGRTFHGVHVEAAARLAAAAREAGVQRLVQLSGLGADAHSAVQLHPQPRGGRGRRARSLSRRHRHPPLGDVCRRGRLHRRPRRDAPHGAGLPDVRRRPDPAAAGLCRGRGRGGRAHFRSAGTGRDL